MSDWEKEIADLLIEEANFAGPFSRVVTALAQGRIDTAGYKNAYETTNWELQRLKLFLEESSPLPKPRPQVGFLHIMKTGGISLLNFFGPKFENIRTLWVFSNGEIESATERYLACFDFITGHFTYSATRRFRKDRILFTFLRHPVDRILSSYWYHRNYEGPVRSGVNDRLVEAAKKYDLVDFLRCDEPQVAGNNHNHQTHALAGDAFLSHRLPEADALDAALSHLAEFAVVGLTERSEESLAMICRHMGWEPAQLDKLNATPKRPALQELATTERDAVEAVNQLDLRLYHAAETRFLDDLHRRMPNEAA